MAEGGIQTSSTESNSPCTRVPSFTGAISKTTRRFTQASETLNQNILALLECPVCYETILPPIFECIAGHLLCFSCRTRMDRCPLCRDDFAERRSRVLENISELLTYSCINSEAGCKVTLSLWNKMDHEDDCDFFLYSCPYTTSHCSWRGLLCDFSEHVKMDHEETANIDDGSTFSFLCPKVNAESTEECSMVQMCYGHYFYVSFKKEKINDDCQTFLFAVYVLNKKKIATRYSYKLTLCGKTQHCCWEGTPLSIREGEITMDMVNTGCLKFDNGVAAEFIDDKGDICADISIFKH